MFHNIFVKECLNIDTIIAQVLLQRIISSVVVIALIIAILIFIRWALKDDRHFKLIFTISITISIVIMMVLGINLSKIVFDIQNEDYITYHGEYIERGGGQKSLKTVVVYDDQGNEIRLLRNGSGETGVFDGIVIYGRRSKIVVEYSGSQKSD